MGGCILGNWPKKEGDFFDINCEKHEKIKIYLSQDLEVEFFNYANNFKEAANIITQNALDSNSISKLDFNFFGLAFLYRHCIELMLKSIGFKYIKKVEERKAFLKDTFHNLYDIAQYITQYIDEFAKMDEEAHIWMMKIFEDMNNIDKESDSFRYPFSIIVKGNDVIKNDKKIYDIKNFFDKQTHVDLLSFANKMEIIYEILKGYYLEEVTVEKEYKGYKPIFLEEGGYYYAQSVIGYNFDRKRFHANVKSYTECAEVLYKYMSDDKVNRKNMFMPLCYLYRNSVELSIKEILFEECDLDYQEALELLNENKHNIYSLWKLIKDDLIKHAQSAEADETIKNAENYIMKLSDIDGKADKFRYPTDKYLNLHFRREKFFDLNVVRNYFEDIITFLRCACTMMSVQNEQLREMEYELSKYYDY